MKDDENGFKLLLYTTFMTVHLLRYSMSLYFLYLIKELI